MGTATDSAMLTVACVYRRGPDLTDEYVFRLKNAVRQHCKAPHRFVCLTSVKFPRIETIPLVANLKGYWNKLELFRKGLFDGPVVYLDIDTIIHNDISDVLTYPHEFTAGYNFARKHVDSMSSWFMAFDGRVDRSYLLDDYNSSTPHVYSNPHKPNWARWGDQGYIQDKLSEWTSIDEIFPGRCASYKWEVRRPGFVPSGVSFVAFHGRTLRPHQMNWRLPNGD